MRKIRITSPEQLAKSKFSFSDPRLPEMLFRYKARNYPETLSADEQFRWKEFCKNRLTGRLAGGSITLDAFYARLHELRLNNGSNENVINALDDYAHALCKVL